jgi:Firmicute plasmid replication protein (RepL)
MEQKRIVQTQVKTTITNDGEVIKQELDVYKIVTGKDSFMRVFLEDMKGYLNITRADDFKILFVLWKMSEWNTGKIVLNKSIKEKIAAEISNENKKKEVSVINNSIWRLTKMELLVREDTGIYILNPDYFFKGYDSELKKTKEYVVSIRYRVEQSKEEIVDEEKHLEFLRKKKQLLNSLEDLQKEMLENTKEFKKVA